MIDIHLGFLGHSDFHLAWIILRVPLPIRLNGLLHVSSESFMGSEKTLYMVLTVYKYYHV